MFSKRFYRDVSGTLLTQALTALSGVLVVYLVSRQYSTEEYGYVYLIKRVSDLTWLILLAGTTVSIPRNKAFLDQIQTGLIERVILLFTPLSVLVFLLVSKWISLLFLGPLHEKFFYVFLALSAGMILYGITYAYLRSSMLFTYSNILQILNFSFAPLVPLLFVSNVRSYLIAFSLIVLGMNLAIYLFLAARMIKLTKKQRIERSNLIQSFRSIFYYGMWRLPGLMLVGLIFTGPVTLLNWLGAGKEVGLLAQIFQILSIVNLPINSMGLVLLPNMSKLAAEKKLDVARANLRKLIRVLTVLSIPATVAIILFSPWLLTLINGYKISFSDIYYGFIFAGIVPLSFYNLLRNPIDAISDKPYSTILVFLSMLISSITGILLYSFSELNYFLLVMMVTFLSFVLLGFFSMVYVRKLYFHVQKKE